MNKLVNISSENEDTIIRDTSLLKKISAGEAVEDSQKFEAQISFRPFCKMIFATNKMLQFADSSDALRRRMRVISFNQRFEGVNKDIDLDKKLLQELPGIFNWAVEGYKCLDKRGALLPESDFMKEAADDLRKHTSSVFAFVEDKCTVSSTKSTTRASLFEEYQVFCRNNGFACFSSGKFLHELKRAVPSIEAPDEKSDFMGKRTRKVYGISMVADDF